MKKLWALLTALILLLPAAAGAETIVTSFYPVWILALNLTEGLEGVDVVNLAEPSTGCLHDYTLQPSDMVTLSRADALLINGAGMESFLPVITAACPDLPVVDATAGLAFISEGDVVEIGEPEEGETVNAHLWLDPLRAADMASNLAGGLIRLMPEKEAQITENLNRYRERLLALGAALREGVGDAGGRKVIIFHEAFPYFAEACGLQVSAIVNKEPEDDISSAQLSRILNIAVAESPLPLILKSAETDRSVEVLVHEAGIPVCELDPMTTGPSDPPLDYYETVMLRNLSVLQEALR